MSINNLEDDKKKKNPPKVTYTKPDANGAKVASSGAERQANKRYTHYVNTTTGAHGKVSDLPKTEQSTTSTKPSPKKWYKGDRPTRAETGAQVIREGLADPTRQADLDRMFADEINNPESIIFEKNAQANSRWLEPFGLSSTTPEWMQANSGLLDYAYYSAKGVTPSDAKKGGEAGQYAAYYYQLAADEERTVKAEQAEAALRDEVAYWVSKGYSDDEIKAKIDLQNNKKYKAISDLMLDDGELREITRPIHSATSYGLDGIIWGARNPEKSKGIELDAYQSALGWGTPYTADPTAQAKRDRGNAAWSPYTSGTTMDDEAIRFGVTEFAPDWFEKNRDAILASGDEDAIDAMEKVYFAEEFTQDAEREAQLFKEYFEDQLELGMSPDEIFTSDLFDDEDFKNLGVLYKGYLTGKPAAVTRGIDLDFAAMHEQAAANYALKQAQKNAPKDSSAMQTAVEAEKQAQIDTNGSLINTDTVPTSLTSANVSVFNQKPTKTFKQGLLWASAPSASDVAPPKTQVEYLQNVDSTPQSAPYQLAGAYSKWTDDQKYAAQNYISDSKGGFDTSDAVQEMKDAGLTDEQINAFRSQMTDALRSEDYSDDLMDAWFEPVKKPTSYTYSEINSAIQIGDLPVALDMMEVNFQNKVAEDPELLHTEDAAKASLAMLGLAAESGVLTDPEQSEQALAVADAVVASMGMEEDGGFYAWLDGVLNMNGALVAASENPGWGLNNTLMWAFDHTAHTVTDLTDKFIGYAITGAGKLAGNEELVQAGEKVANEMDATIAGHSDLLMQNGTPLEIIGGQGLTEMIKMSTFGKASQFLNAGTAIAFGEKFKWLTRMISSTPFALESGVREFDEAYEETDGNYLTSFLSGMAGFGATALMSRFDGILKNIEAQGMPFISEVVDSLSAVPGSGAKATLARWGKAGGMWLWNLVKTGVNEAVQEPSENIVTTFLTDVAKGSNPLDRDWGAYGKELIADGAMAFLISMGSSVSTMPTYANSVKVAEAQMGKTELTQQDVEQFITALQEDANNPQIQEEAGQRAQDIAVEVKTGELAAQSGAPSADTSKTDGAQKKVEKAQTAVEQATAESQKATQKALSANERMKENYADPQVSAEAKNAWREKAAADQRVESAQQALTEAQEEATAAQTETQAQNEASMDALRSQAATEVEHARSEMDAQKAQQAEAAEQQRQTDNETALETDDFISTMLPDQEVSEEDRQLIEQKIREQKAALAPDASDKAGSGARARFVTQMSKRFGVTIRVMDTTHGGQHLRYNGAYDPKTDSIVIDSQATQSDVIYGVLLHELTHKAERSDVYQEFASAILKIKYGDNDKQLAADIKAKRDSYNSRLKEMKAVDESVDATPLTEDAARREIVADLTREILFGDEASIQKLCAEKPSVARRMLETIKNFINKLRGVKDPAMDQLNKARELFEKALSQEAQNNTASTEGNNLVAAHTLSFDALSSMLEIGGFPAPSIAVLDPDRLSSFVGGFGNIAVIFGKESVDPTANEANHLYSTDAYSPSQGVRWNKIRQDKQAEIQNAVSNFMDEQMAVAYAKDGATDNELRLLRTVDGTYNTSPLQLADLLANTYTGRMIYAQELGINVQEAFSSTILPSVNYSKETAKEYYQQLLDNSAKLLKGQDIKKWAEEKAKDLVESTVKNEYTRQSFPFTTEGLLANARSQRPTRNYLNYGLGKIRHLPTAALKEFDSIDQAKSEHWRVEELSSEQRGQEVGEYAAFRDKVIDDLSPLIPDTQELTNILLEGAEGGHDPKNVLEFFQSKGVALSKKLARRISQLYQKAQDQRNVYFESKPDRVLGLDELKAILVPSELKEQVGHLLQQYGLNVDVISMDSRATLTGDSVRKWQFSLPAETDPNEKLLSPSEYKSSGQNRAGTGRTSGTIREGNRGEVSAEEGGEVTAASSRSRVQYSLPSDSILDEMVGSYLSRQTEPEPQTTRPQGQRQFVEQTMQESNAVPEWIKREFRNRPDDLNYDIDSNREQVERGWQRIQQNGYDAELNRLMDEERFSADDTAEANLMMAMALHNDDPGTFMALASKYGKEGTKAGQELQARKLFSRMTPTGIQIWVASKLESSLGEYMRTHRPKKQQIDRRAEQVANQIRDLDNTDVMRRLMSGEDVTIDSSNNRWGTPINQQQQALIDHYNLNNVARPGIFYNRATTEQRMLEAILATPNPLALTGNGLNLIQRLEMIADGEAVITNADLQYIGTRLAEFVGAGGEVGGRNADVAIARAYEAFGNITPATFGEKARTWRYISMLTSVPSAIRNVIGNAGQNLVNAAAHGVAVEIDKLISGQTGRRTAEHLNVQERVNGWKSFVDETKNTFRDYFVDKVTTQRGEDKYNTSQRGRVYQSPVLEATRNLESFMMSFGDRNVWKKTYVNSLAEQQKLADQGLLYNDDGTTRTNEQMIEQAERDANYATFTEDNQVSQILGQLKQVPGIGVVVDYIMPFTGVPANITRRMIQYSPISFVTTAYTAASNAARGQNFDQKAFVDGMARGLTGTALFGVGMLLAQMGAIKMGTGEEEDKKKYGLQTAMGHQYTPYIYNPFTDEYVSLAVFSPAASALTMGGAAWMDFKDNDDAIQALQNAAFGSIDQIFDASYMSGLSDLFGGYGSFGENLRDTLLENVVSQNIPTILNQIGSAIDPYVRDTKDKNSIMQILKTAQSKIPFLRELLPEKVDVTGQSVKNKEGLRPLYDPFTTTDARQDPVVDELLRLNEVIGDNTMLPSDALSGTKNTLSVSVRLNGKKQSVKVTLDGHAKESYRKRYGELWTSEVAAFMNTARYRSLDDVARAKEIKKILGNVLDEVKLEFYEQYGADEE